MKQISGFIRVITVAPLMALYMLLVLYADDPAFFGKTAVFALSVMFLTVFPLLAYPMQPLFKKYRDKGREGQRSLAMVFAVAGYVLGCVSVPVFAAPKNVLIIFLAYLASGALVMLINKLLGFRASGHACGVTGPCALLILFGKSAGLGGLAALAAVWFSSLYMKRHTSPQLAVGAAVPVAIMVVIALVNRII